MGERKVLNKYIPSDFDPSLVPKHKNTREGRKKKNKKDGDKIQVRMMIPFSMQCVTCGTFMYRGKKFNSYKENVAGSNSHYLGIQRFRFYIKCVCCSRQITFLTDPEHNDYELESGASRNYEIWKDRNDVDGDPAAKDADGDGTGDDGGQNAHDHMENLEKRVLDSRREMDEHDALEEIMALNSKHNAINSNSAAQRQESRGDADDEDIDFEGIKKMYESKRNSVAYRINDDDGIERGGGLGGIGGLGGLGDTGDGGKKREAGDSGGFVGAVLKKKKRKVVSEDNSASAATTTSAVKDDDDKSAAERSNVSRVGEGESHGGEKKVASGNYLFQGYCGSSSDGDSD